MLALSGNSETTLLEVIIFGSIALAILSVFLYILLAIHRVRRHFQEKKIQRLESQWSEAILHSTFTGEPLPIGPEKQQDLRCFLRAYLSILGQLRGGDRRKALRLLDTPAIRQHLLARTKSRHRDQRLRAINTLVQLNDIWTVNHLWNALQDQDWEVRVQAALGLTQLGAIKSMREIYPYIENHGHDDAFAVGDFYHKLGTALLLDAASMISHDISSVHKRHILSALEDRNLPETIPLVLELLQSPDPFIRRNCWQILSRADDPRCIPFLPIGMADSSPEVRARAALCAGDFRHLDSIPLLQSMLNDNDWWVRFRSAEALIRMRKPGIDILLDAVRHTGGEAREISRQVLRQHRIYESPVSG